MTYIVADPQRDSLENDPGRESYILEPEVKLQVRNYYHTSRIKLKNDFFQKFCTNQDSDV